MIIIEQNIELCIYHWNNAYKFNVVEIHQNKDVFFKVLYGSQYFCTLVPDKNSPYPNFQLSEKHNNFAIDINEGLLSKIRSSLYTVYLPEIPS